MILSPFAIVYGMNRPKNANACKVKLTFVILFVYSERPFLYLKISKMVQKKVHAKKAFSGKKGSHTDFSYNSLILNKIMDIKGFAY